jgi:DNA repair exonuclease SbcCD ATPase subunit
MVMYFTSLEAENFLSIGEVKMPLAGGGLIVLVGDNLDDPSVFSNGSGKSSLVESIYWCLFGKLLRKNKYSDGVVNKRVKKNCRVRVALTVKSGSLEIERFRKHKERKNDVLVHLNGEPQHATDPRVTQRVIDKLLGMDQEMFSRLVFVGQGFNQRFTEMNDRALKEFIEGLTGSLLYARAHGMAKDCLEIAVAALEKLEGARQSLADSLERAEEQIRDEEVVVEEAEKRRVAKLEELREGINGHQYEIAQIKETLEAMGAERDANVAQYDKQVSDWRSHEETISAQLAGIKVQQQQVKVDKRAEQGVAITAIHQGIEALREQHRVSLAEARAAKKRVEDARDLEISSMASARTTLIESLNAARRPVDEAFSQLQNEIANFQTPQVPQACVVALVMAESKLKALDERLAQDEAKIGTDCPTCGKTITEDDVRKRIAETYDPDQERSDLVDGPGGIRECAAAVKKAEEEAEAEKERQEQVRVEALKKQTERSGVILGAREEVGEFDAKVSRIPERHKPAIDAAEAEIQRIASEHEAQVAEEERKRAALRSAQEAEIDALDDAHRAATEDLSAQIAKANVSLQEVQRIRQAYIDEVGGVAEQHQNTLNRFENDVNVLELQIVTLNGQDLQATLRTLQGNRAHLQEQLQENGRKTKEAQDAQYLYDYLTTAFGLGGIRSYMMDSILSYLNERLKEHCLTLHDGRTNIELSPVFQQKNKAVVDKISLVVSTDGGSYDLSSGGECRKIDVALFLAFRDLNRLLSPVDTNLEAYDEMLDGLDGEAARRVIQLLVSDQSVETKILITHRADVPILGQHKVLKAVKQLGVTSYLSA